jgi:predicted glutamine amidotransferase
MCSIIGWKGRLPQGLLTNLIVKSACRGKDSTGIAYYGKFKKTLAGPLEPSKNGAPGIGAYRKAVAPSAFVKMESAKVVLSAARRSTAGIAHTRRASPGMPIDDTNAHPFQYWDFFFAHNGKVDNWLELKDVLVDHFRKSAEIRTAEGSLTAAQRTLECMEYSKNVTTDSQVLAPFINSRDFEIVEGCMALVWLKGPDVYTMRYAKEAIAAKIMWQYKVTADTTKGEERSEDEDESDFKTRMVTIVASTREIVNEALDKIKDTVDFAVDFMEIPESRIFKLDVNGLIDEGPVKTSDHISTDEHSSATV